MGQPDFGPGTGVVGVKKAAPALTLFLSFGLCACTLAPTSHRAVNDLPPLHLRGATYVDVSQVSQRVVTPDLLTLNSDMRDFVKRYTADVKHARARLQTLHRAISGPATLGLRYDPQAAGSAEEVFRRGTANCLSYASLFIALAREAGLDAHYQFLEVRPQWARQGERVMVRQHVNVLVNLNNRQQFMVDIDPLEPLDIAASLRLDDSGAQALHHNNISMEALAKENIEMAWLHAVRALQISPEAAHLWVNLGAIYRAAGQHKEAENSYHYALELDPLQRSAMNNLMVLYGLQGRLEQRDYWQAQIAHYREANPYYQAWLGEQAVGLGDWARAVSAYEEAVALAPGDGRLLFALGMVHGQMDAEGLAIEYMQRAIVLTNLHSQLQQYRQALAQLQRRQLAKH